MYLKHLVFAARVGLLWTATRKKTPSNLAVLIAGRKVRRKHGANGLNIILRMDLCRIYKGKDCSAIIASVPYESSLWCCCTIRKRSADSKQCEQMKRKLSS